MITSNAITINLQAHQCPCGQIWDSVLQECSPLIPYTVTANVGNVNIYYACNHTNLHSWPTSPNALCTKSSAVYKISVSGKVTDSEGHPICGQIVDIIPNNFGIYEVQVNYTESIVVSTITVSVTWVIHVSDGSAKTDSNGNFSTYLAVSASVLATNDSLATVPGCYTGNLVTIPVIATLSVAGTQITNVSTGTIYFQSADVGATT
ncbi:MAG: hypothetical protein OWS74_09475 [Firmicutes bacterium]|nr:hypothetical protein [Bacillota bacterium]